MDEKKDQEMTREMGQETEGKIKQEMGQEMEQKMDQNMSQSNSPESDHVPSNSKSSSTIDAERKQTNCNDIVTRLDTDSLYVADLSQQEQAQQGDDEEAPKTMLKDAEEQQDQAEGQDQEEERVKRVEQAQNQEQECRRMMLYSTLSPEQRSRDPRLASYQAQHSGSESPKPTSGAGSTSQIPKGESNTQSTPSEYEVPSPTPARMSIPQVSRTPASSEPGNVNMMKDFLARVQRMAPGQFPHMAQPSVRPFVSTPVLRRQTVVPTQSQQVPQQTYRQSTSIGNTPVSSSDDVVAADGPQIHQSPPYRPITTITNMPSFRNMTSSHQGVAPAANMGQMTEEEVFIRDKLRRPRPNSFFLLSKSISHIS